MNQLCSSLYESSTQIIFTPYFSWETNFISFSAILSCILPQKLSIFKSTCFKTTEPVKRSAPALAGGHTRDLTACESSARVVGAR